MLADKTKLDYIQQRIDIVVDRVAEVGKDVGAFRVFFEDHDKRETEHQAQLQRLAETLHNNTESLQSHVHRTDLLEEYVKKVDARFTPIETERIRKTAVNMWFYGRLKLFVKIGGAVSAVGAIGLIAKHVVQYWLSH